MISCRSDLFKVHKDMTMIVPMDVFFDFIEDKPNHCVLDRITANIDDKAFHGGEEEGVPFDASKAGRFANDKKMYVLHNAWLLAGKAKQLKRFIPLEVIRTEPLVFKIKDMFKEDPRVKFAEVWGSAVIERPEDGKGVHRITMHIEVA